MIPGAFDYHRPGTLDEALQMLSSLGDEARVLAGGHSLIPMMKLRMAQPEHLIDLQGIDILRGIEIGDMVVIGAMTTQAELIAHDGLAEAVPILREAALQISDPQVRNLGTVGGNVANGDPGNDMPGIMQCLDARFEVEGPEGTRVIAARGFYDSAYVTQRQDNEILTRVHIPRPPAGHGFAYEKQKRKIGDYATAAAAVQLTVEGGRCAAASIAMTNLADTPIWAEEAGRSLVGTDLGGEAIDAATAHAIAVIDPASDNKGPAEFKRHVAGVMLRRALARAAEIAS